MTGRKAAIAAALWICCAGVPSSSAPYDEADLKSRQERAEREWPGLVQRVVKGVAEHCAGRQVPAKVLLPDVLYRGAIADMAVSKKGAVAVTDVARGFVLVFDSTERSEAPLQISLGSGFSSHSLGFSEAGRYLAWATPFETYIYDLHARQFALVLGQFGERQMQWIGDDLLLIGNDDYNMNFTTTSLFRLKNGAFHREVLDTMVFGKGHYPRDSSDTSTQPVEYKIAMADQFGMSFLSENEVLYSSVGAAIQDRADVSVHKSTNSRERVYRIGDRLVQPSDNGNLFLKPDTPWSLLLRDGTSGKVMKSIPLPVPGCAPDELAIAGDQSKIAMLIGWSLLILDPTDLSVKAIYGLDARSFTMPESIAMAPDESVVVWSASLDPAKQTIFVYRLKQ